VPETPIALARKAAPVLAERGLENARLEAELLLAGVLGIARLDLYLQHERPLTEAEVAAFRVAVRRRLRREPLQYILGRAAFRHLLLRVDERVLIPRPETEQLVGAVLEWSAARGSGAGGGAETQALTVLDVGTGSGAIALSLAREGPFRRVVATDVSPAALEVAAANAAEAGLADRVEFRVGPLWEGVAAGERFDIIVSNPPYIGESERASLAPEVRDWEPALALFGGASGLAVLEPLIRGAPARLRGGGLLAVEIGFTQAEAVRQIAQATAGYAEVRILQDLAGRERMLLATAEDSCLEGGNE
jgi:release factor glutamine methyltransferase